MSISEADYFVMAEKAERPLDYINGAVRTRADSSPRHATIAARLAGGLALPLRETKYEPVSVGLRVKAGPGARYYYPDSMVFHDAAEFDERAPNTLLTPIVLAEIFSDATEIIDRTEKLDAYLSIPALQDYLIIDQSRVRIHHYQRNSQSWLYRVYGWNSEEIHFDCFDISIPVAALYGHLNLPEGFVLLSETPE